MADTAEQLKSEAEIREEREKFKRAFRISVLVTTLILVLTAVLVDLGSTGRIIVGAIVVYEIISYPFMIRMMDRHTEQVIADQRDEQGLTPAEDLPDVGV